ncbi:hypothetical protein [Puniceibacterium sp. IMCC21224]|uniref:hypothetical protein n=1 Tax=Puniceibacterium sp. IMCC21224 TaxID=1618204 RepID=UPI00064DEA9A|nr:hypothetical protein [Puniceibacterium sp. IMCC21224]KMK66017.1 hypothetical protein IMCC21224_11863 [Puniceibacterium sp. IMCC21224]
MEQKPAPRTPTQNDRDTRLKAALKANLARRKAQARARSDVAEQDTVRGDAAGADPDESKKG